MSNQLIIGQDCIEIDHFLKQLLLLLFKKRKTVKQKFTEKFYNVCIFSVNKLKLIISCNVFFFLFFIL